MRNRPKVVIVAKKSAIGIDNHTPFNPMCIGNIYRAGTKNNTWRVKLRSIDLPACPIH